MTELPGKDDLGGIYSVSGALLDDFPTLLLRLLSQAAFIAEEVQAAVGLERLPDVEPPANPAS